MSLYPRLIIAGLRGGSGKTTLSLGLIHTLREERMKVIPFKKGPDYIDAGWLARAAGHPCYNLDPFLIGNDRLFSSFVAHAAGGDMAVIEGNRGVYDGMDEEGTYSTAEIAKTLKAPVILIIDCTKATRTVASLVYGVQQFDRGITIRGVVLNQIAGSRHESIIRKSIERYCTIPVLGALPRLSKEHLPERHMGLVPFHEHPEVEQAIRNAAALVKKYTDVKHMVHIAEGAEPLSDGAPPEQCEMVAPRQNIRIGVIRDSAFQFYYPENFQELRKRGAEIVEVSALSQERLPDIHALYIGGGFPETHAIALAENVGFRNSLKCAIGDGLPVYAECGGLMYLSESITLENRTYPMTGTFPFVFSLEKKPQAHGYSMVEVIHDNPYFPKGTVLRGHEFHYSRPTRVDGETKSFYYAFSMKRGQGIHEKMDGICYKNTLATYTHLHAYGAPEWVEGMLRCALDFSNQTKPITTNDKTDG